MKCEITIKSEAQVTGEADINNVCACFCASIPDNKLIWRRNKFINLLTSKVAILQKYSASFLTATICEGISTIRFYSNYENVHS